MGLWKMYSITSVKLVNKSNGCLNLMDAFKVFRKSLEFGGMYFQIFCKFSQSTFITTTVFKTSKGEMTFVLFQTSVKEGLYVCKERFFGVHYEYTA